MKKRKIVKGLLAGTLALSMCMAATNTAFATEVNDSTNTKKVAITKELDIAEGIQTPETAFTFTFTQDTEGANVAKSEVAIKSVTLKFINSDPSTDEKIIKESKDVLAGITWPSAGVYKYTVKETVGETTIDNGNGEGTMTYDTTVYTMQVIVKNGENGTEVDNVVVGKDDTDGSTTKVDGSPSTDEEKDSVNGDNENDADSATGNDFRFVNTYTKNGGGTDPVNPDPGTEDPDPAQSALKIAKNVVGELADLNTEFTFNVNIQFPSTAKVETAQGFIYNADGTYVSDAAFANGDNTFNLKHGQYLTFKTLPAGTKYTVKETGTENYTGVTSTVANGGEAVTVNGEKGTDVSTAQSLVGELTNSTTVTNTYDDQSVTPTGIIVNNLPYIALIAVAVIGCVVIVLGKKRRMN